MASIRDGEITYQEGVVPYDLNTALYSDGAVKRRAVFLPKGTTAQWSDNEVFDFPVGTVLLKSFGFRTDLRDPNSKINWVETRVVLRAPEGWFAYPYVWDTAGTRATYAPGGRQPRVNWTDASGAPQTLDYLVPSETECKQCHSSNAQIIPIGPKARNLNRMFTYPDGTSDNQLAHWSKAGIVSGAPADPTTVAKLAVWDDPSGPIADRARAYLEVNCAHCHSAGGTASTSGLFLWASESDPLRYGVCKEPLSAGPGAGTLTWDVVPGLPDQSIVVYRMASTAPGVSMPQIGRGTVHTAAVQLVRDWITGLAKGPCNP